MVYWRFDEESPPALTLVARVRGNPERALTLLRDVVRSVDPAVPVYDVKTLERRLSDTLARPKFYTQATFFLGGLAALVAAAGIFGSAARSVSQRRREMGIRMAIGATSRQVRALVLRETITPVTVGVGIGIGGALASGRYLEHLIGNTGSVTPGVCIAAAVLMLGIAAVAAWRATARVLSIDPAEAVRVDLL
jgi:putative ABC transport system permease protein